MISMGGYSCIECHYVMYAPPWLNGYKHLFICDFIIPAKIGVLFVASTTHFTIVMSARRSNVRRAYTQSKETTNHAGS